MQFYRSTTLYTLGKIIQIYSVRLDSVAHRMLSTFWSRIVLLHVLLFESKFYVNLIGRLVLWFLCSCLVRESAQGDAKSFFHFFSLFVVL